MKKVFAALCKFAAMLWNLWQKIPEDDRKKAIQYAADALKEFWSRKWDEAQARKEQTQ